MCEPRTYLIYRGVGGAISRYADTYAARKAGEPAPDNAVEVVAGVTATGRADALRTWRNQRDQGDPAPPLQPQEENR